MQKFQDEDQILFEAIEAYRNGSEDKATDIYESTKKYTYKIVHQEVVRFKSLSVLAGDEVSITEDVMQDLYLNFFNNIAKFRNEDPRSIFKWITIVSHRMILDYVDKNKMEVLQFEKDGDFREENDIWDSSEINDSDMESNHELLPEEALEDKEFQQLILGFIQSLPEAQAQTVLLHFRGGLKYQEIADEMGVSLITVKTRMKKAKDSLEEIINMYEKKTGTKLHSVSILPLLWLLYRMAAEETVVPVAIDTAVASTITASTGVVMFGAGTATTVGTAAVSKIIGVKTLIAIVSSMVVIGGGAYVGSQLLDKKDTVAEKSQEVEDEEQTEQGDVSGGKQDNTTNNASGNNSVNDESPNADEDDSVTENEEKSEGNTNINNSMQDSDTEEGVADGTNDSSETTDQSSTSTTPEPEGNTDTVKYALYDSASYERFDNCVSIVKKNGKAAGHALTTTSTFMNYYDYGLALSNGTADGAWMCMSIGVWSNVEGNSRLEDYIIYGQIPRIAKLCLETIAPQGGTELYNEIDSLILQYGHPCDVPSQGQISESIPGLYVTVVHGENGLELYFWPE